jgi:glycosyltransferase involved in cell wall biosynthesis
MKILILSLEYSPGASGGVGTHVQELSTGLARAGDSVTVLAGTVGRQERHVEGRKTVHLVPPDKNQKPGTSITQGILDYNSVLASYARRIILPEQGAPDLIHCHNWITYPAAADLARTLGIPTITTVHYVSEPAERWWGQTPDPEILAQEGLLFRQQSQFIAVSGSIQSLMREGYSVPEESVEVIYNAVEPASFLPASLPVGYLDRLRASVAPSGEKIVLYTGRFHPMKGISAMLKSAILVLQHEPNVRYLMAGEPDSQAFALEFREHIDRNPILQEKLTVLGKLSRQRVAMLYSLADLALLPSVYDPCPYAAIEAMAAGVPLVASDGGGLAELVEHEVNGLAVPVRIGEAGMRSVNPEELAQATMRLLRDDDLARRLGEGARQIAAEKYNMEVMIRSTRTVYQGVMSRNHVHAIP